MQIKIAVKCGLLCRCSSWQYELWVTCVRVSHALFRKTKRQNEIFYLLSNSMWQGLLLDPLLSPFGQSGGRHFKLQLDEVRVLITWLRSSIPVVCMCMRVFLTWIFFFSENISREHSGSVSLQSLRTVQVSQLSVFMSILLPQAFRSLKISPPLIQKLAQLQFQLFVSGFCSLSEGFTVLPLSSLSVSRKSRSCPLCWRDCCICLSPLFISHHSLLSRANIHTISVAAHFLSALHMTPDLTLSLSSLPFCWSPSLCCSPALFFSALFKLPCRPTSVNTLLKNVIIFFFNKLLIWLIKWHLISIGLFREDSVSLQFSCSASSSTPLPFFVDSCCHSCESLLQLLWACMSVLVTNGVRVPKWLRPTRLFAMNCLKGCWPFNAEYLCVLAEFAKCVHVLVHICLLVCVHTVCF